MCLVLESSSRGPKLSKKKPKVQLVCSFVPGFQGFMQIQTSRCKPRVPAPVLVQSGAAGLGKQHSSTRTAGWVGCWHRPGAVQCAGRSQSSRRAVLPQAEVAVTQWPCSQDGHAPPGLIFLFTNEVPWQEERFSPRVRCKVCLNPQALHCTAVGLLLSHLSLVAPASAFRTCLHPDLHPCLVITNI